MTLAGTRPPTLDEWNKYELHHRARLAIKPGITGMWQVSGRSEITDFEEVVKLDTEYISEALLKYMSLPRVPIETTFKKVREFLFAKTSGKQIPWEHTSFVGEFYFNPDTIYDAFVDRKNNLTQLNKKKRFTVRDGMTRYSKK